jgi:hypothetical protein
LTNRFRRLGEAGVSATGVTTLGPVPFWFVSVAVEVPARVGVAGEEAGYRWLMGRRPRMSLIRWTWEKSGNVSFSSRRRPKEKKKTYLDHDRQDSSVEREQEAAVGDEDQRGQLAELLKSSDSTRSSNQQHDDFQSVIPDDARPDPLDSVDHDRSRRDGRSPLDGRLLARLVGELVRVSGLDDGLPSEDDRGNLGTGEDGFSESEGFVEADGDDKEGEGFGEADRVDGNGDNGGGKEGGQKGEGR